MKPMPMSKIEYADCCKNYMEYIKDGENNL